MYYFICGYCGKSGISLFRRLRLFWPRCNCKGGNGRTFMSRASKKGFKSNNANQKLVRQNKKDKKR